jgi:WD40 repeat protein
LVHLFMFDPYHRWLAIPKDQRPPTYYQLLGIAADESDTEVIEEAALRQTSHVRLYQTGPQSAQCTDILNELGQARATLLNPEKRKQYDASLRLSALEAIPSLPVEERPGAIQPPPLPDWMPAESAMRASPNVSGRAPPRGSPVLPAVGYGLLLLFGAGLAFGVGMSRPAARSETSPVGTSTDDGEASAARRDAGETLEGHEAAVRALAVSSDGSVIVSAGGDYAAGMEGEPIGCALRLWDPRKGALVRLLVGHRSAVHCLALSPDGRQVLSGSGGGQRWRDGAMAAEDCVVRLWNLKDGEEKLTFTEHKTPVRGVAYLPSGKFAVSCSSDGNVLLWEVNNPAKLKSLAETLSPAECLAVSSSGKHLAVGGSDGQLRLWSLPGKPEEITRRFPSGREPIHAVAFSPNGEYLASAGGRIDYQAGKAVATGCVVRVWDVASGKRMAPLVGHTGPIRTLAWGPDGRLASGSLDGTVRLWNAKDGSLIRTFAAGSGVTSAALPSHRKQLMAGTLAGLVRIWDLDKTSASRGGEE